MVQTEVSKKKTKMSDGGPEVSQKASSELSYSEIPLDKLQFSQEYV